MLGIDVSKATLVCTLVDPRDQRVCWETAVPNTTTGIARLMQRTSADYAWVVEPTGRYSDLRVQQGHAAGRTVLMAQPKRAKAFLAAVSPRAKTDRVDSRGLALYGLATPLRPFVPKSETMMQTEQLLAARKGISDSLARLRQQQQALPYAAAHLAAAITALQSAQATIDRELATLTRQEEAVTRLRTIPGIGPVTAAAVAVCLTSKEFGHSDQFVAYVGLDVRVRESGQQRGKRTLSHQGDAELRRFVVLVCAGELTQQRRGEPIQGAICTGTGEGADEYGGVVCGGTQAGADVRVADEAWHGVRGDTSAAATRNAERKNDKRNK